MAEQTQFETPENIQVSYDLAGQGTRFVAWVTDQILLFFLAFFLFFALICSGIATESVLRDVAEPLRDVAEEIEDSGGDRPPQLPLYFLGVFTLVWGLGSFFYFGFSELLLRGQTIGKRSQQIRVVRDGGFSLDAGSIFVRNIFRVVDHLPPLWIVPVVSAKSQRLGDMVAGTLVVLDKPEQISNVRHVLAQRPPVERNFRFDAVKLKRLRSQDVESIERILERWSGLSFSERETFLSQVVPALAKRLQAEVPEGDDRLLFLEDLLAAEYRRQDRSLG